MEHTEEYYKNKIITIPNILSLFQLLLIPVIIHLIWFNIPGVISGILIGACTALALLSAFMYSRENLKKLHSKR